MKGLAICSVIFLFSVSVLLASEDPYGPVDTSTWSISTVQQDSAGTSVSLFAQQGDEKKNGKKTGVDRLVELEEERKRQREIESIIVWVLIGVSILFGTVIL